VDSMEVRLQRMEDLQEIHQLFTDYGRHLDRRDMDAYAELFADDGELLLGPVARAKGRDEIRATMTRVLGAAASTSFHLVTNADVRLDGDRATSEVMWTVVERAPDGKPVVGAIGRHVDDLVRERGRWRFARRRGFVDIPTTMA
jgi:uncharacterized protein (TIGR02246 family)